MKRFVFALALILFWTTQVFGQSSVLTQQPQNQTAGVGQTARFTIIISDPTCTVMWQRNGVNIFSGVGLVSYTTPPVKLADNGAKFGAVVYNCETAANAHSNTATLTVTMAAVTPTISVQPANQTGTVGQTATFSVVTSGTAPLSYQWQKNSTNITGANAATYTTPATLATDNGATFDVLVSNSVGSAMSSMATLTVNADTAPPLVPTNLAATAVTSSSVSLTWTASADNVGVAGYHVFRNNAQVATTTGASYTDIGLTASTAYTYTVNAFDAAGNVSAVSSPITATTAAASYQPVYPLMVSANGRYLVDKNNTPFFITGDQAWELVTELSDGDVNTYLSDRASRGYNVLWLGAADNLYQSNPPYDSYGDKPFDGADFTNEDAAYWAHVDYVIQQAESFGITVMIDPGFVGLDASSGYYASYLISSDAVLTAYGAWLGARYSSFPNIIWALGGDADPATSGLYSKLSHLATGIKSTDTGHLMTFEATRFTHGSAAPNGGYSSLDVWSGPPSWLNLNWMYLNSPNIPSSVEANYSRSPWLPPLMGEDWYEGEHSITPLQLRQEGYGAILGGAYLGRIFGNNAIWSFGSPTQDTMGATWQSQLGSSGSVSQANLGALFRSREHWLLVPDTNNTVMTAGSQSGTTIAVTARTSDGQSIIAYIPTQRATTIDMTKISDTSAQVWWFNPQTASSMLIGTFPTTVPLNFTPPDQNDWVLVIDAASANLPPPGSGTLLPTSGTTPP
jgi:hypothetical protein